MDSKELSYEIRDIENIEDAYQEDILQPIRIYDSNVPYSEDDNDNCCVICLDDEPNKLYNNKYFIEFSTCNCKYYVHKDCIDTWHNQTSNRSRFSKCLICSSDLILKKTYKNYFSNFKTCFSIRCGCYIIASILILLILAGH